MKEILDMIRRGISDLKDENDKFKSACAAQIAARAYNKDEAYDEVLKILDTLQANADASGFFYVNFTWNDIKEIVSIAEDILPDPRYKQDLAASFQTEESFYQEVLRRYKEGLK